MSKQLVRPISLIDLLRMRAEKQGERLAFSFLQESTEQDVQITYTELDLKVRALGAYLQSVSSPGERALLLYTPGIDYIVAFFGCLYAGLLAVPAYPPRQNNNLDRLQAVVKDAQASITLTSSAIARQISHRFADNPILAPVQCIETNEIRDEFADHWKETNVSADSLAFLQYTSGSTSSPKGVMLSHGNLMHNLSLIESSFGLSSESRGVIWLPPYHDMGLIGGILQPLYSGYPMSLMAPADFIQRPLKWLQAISQTKATVSGGPNFAYDLCLQKMTPEQRAELDLSSWDTAFSGAEPIRPETLRRFADAFAPCGFRHEAFYACYGLAEGTLLVSGGLKSEPPVVKRFDGQAMAEHCVVEQTDPENTQSHLLVSSGSITRTDEKIVIVNPQTLMCCSNDEIGEIWISGASVAQGYWNQEKLTQDVFHARLADTGEGPFLRTGDLGFVQEGELFITGRMKDLIIIRGRNHYPQDIEFTVQECHEAVRTSNGAAFSVEVDGEEKLVVVQEVLRSHRKGNHDEVITSIRRAIAEAHQLQVHAVVLIKPASISKTSSGKVQRHACRERFLTDRLDVVARSLLQGASGSEQTDSIESAEQFEWNREYWMTLSLNEQLSNLEEIVIFEARRVLRDDRVPISREKSLYDLGLDSLKVMEVKHGVEEIVGVTLSLADFIDGTDVSEICQRIKARLNDKAADQSDQRLQAGGETEGKIPLSYGQRSLWFMQNFASERTAYNIARAVRIVDGLDVNALHAALQGLVDCHSQLRTTFTLQEGQLHQQIQEGTKVSFNHLDATDWSQDALDEHLQTEANRPFDLEKGPLFRAYLYARSDGHVLLICAHHIVIDYWSFGILLKDLGRMYDQARTGLALETKQPGGEQYGAFVRWQQELIDGREGERLWSFWKESLEGELPVLHLPTNRPRPPIQTFRGGSKSFELSLSLTKRLKDLAKEQGTTMYVTLLSAFFAMIHRYTGQEDLLIGSPTAGRSNSKFANVLGYFVDPMIVRGRPSSSLPFRDFMQQLKRTVQDSLRHQDFPFALLVERLQSNRDLSYPPLFQVMFTLQNGLHEDGERMNAFALGQAGGRLTVGGMIFESYPLTQSAAQVDLALAMGETNGGYAGSFEYNTDLFDDETIDRIITHFLVMLEGVAEHPDQEIGDLPLLLPEEKHQILTVWNDTRTAYPEDVALHHLFESQVERTPNATAVIFENQELTYRELNVQSNRLAHHLKKLGVGPDVLVGICMERSLEMVIGLFGILKAGGAYVPIDPALPSERISYMMQDANCPVLLTQQKFVEQLPGHDAEVLCLDTNSSAWANESEENVESGVTPKHLAYMIYTSGTTGNPKGVLIPHRGICNRLFWIQDVIELSGSDRVLQKTPFSFDVSVGEFFWPLMAGACLVVAKPEGHLDSRYLAETIISKQITSVHFVPSMLQVFLEEEHSVHCTSLRRVMCSGEALSYELQERFYKRFDVPLYNLYGPTEASVEVSSWACQLGSERSIVPIGRPIANLRLYILDSHMNVVPIGVAGELYIGGTGVGRGYHKRPELTAEKFIPDPFTNETDARLYKTGDLARYLPDGVIEYLGRIDHQVKIRGFRIEIGEIEEVLAGHPAIQEVVVLAVADATGSQQLVAYYKPDLQNPPNTQELRTYLKEKLPDYMVPAGFVAVPEMPLTSNGKLNRSALPAFERGRDHLTVEYAEPRTPVELSLAGIWSEVLQIERIGIHDHFFELGGHSLLATQIITRIRRDLQIDLPVRKLFECPTVAELALWIDSMSKRESKPRIGLKRLARDEHRVK